MILFMILYFVYVIISLSLVVYAYMCAILLIIDSLRYSWKRFHSSWVSVGRRHITIFHILGSGVWHGFVGIRAGLVICHIYNQVTYMIIIYEIIWVNSYLTPSSDSILIQSILENPWTVTLLWLSHPYSHHTYSVPPDDIWLDYSWFKLMIDIFEVLTWLFGRRRIIERICNAPIPWIRKCHCNVYTQNGNILTYIR